MRFPGEQAPAEQVGRLPKIFARKRAHHLAAVPGNEKYAAWSGKKQYGVVAEYIAQISEPSWDRTFRRAAYILKNITFSISFRVPYPVEAWPEAGRVD